MQIRCTVRSYHAVQSKALEMPTNLHALIRFRTIDRCLQRTALTWNWRALSEACQATIHEQTGRDVDAPSRRTILQDIAFMRLPEPGFNAPIVWDRRQKSYRYTKPGFSIFQMPLSDQDLSELRQALAIIRQYQGFDRLEHFEKLLTRLEKRIHIKRQNEAPCIFFETNPRTTGLRWLNELYQHIRRSQCLDLKYRPFEPDRQEQYTFSPYLLKEYNNRWFLIGHNHSEHKTWTLALDRILAIAPNKRTAYYRDPAFNVESWFRDIIGVTVLEDVKKQEVVIRVSPLQARYLETKPLHHSQRVIQRDTTFVDFVYSLQANYELEAALLELGERVEVLSPASLRERIKERLSRALEQYS